MSFFYSMGQAAGSQYHSGADKVAEIKYTTASGTFDLDGPSDRTDKESWQQYKYKFLLPDPAAEGPDNGIKLLKEWALVDMARDPRRDVQPTSKAVIVKAYRSWINENNGEMTGYDIRKIWDNPADPRPSFEADDFVDANRAWLGRHPEMLSLIPADVYVVWFFNDPEFFKGLVASAGSDSSIIVSCPFDYNGEEVNL